MTDDNLPDPEDPAYEIRSDDPLLQTTRGLHAILGRLTRLLGKLLWPVFLLERFFLGVTKPVTYLVRGWLPYGYHFLRSTVKLSVYFGTALVLVATSTLSIDATFGMPAPVLSLFQSVTTRIDTLLSHVQNTPVAFALAITGYYAIAGVLPYQPKDEHQQAWRTRNRPEGPYEWEYPVFTIVACAPLTVLFVVAEFAPSLLSRIPYGLVGTALGAAAGSLLGILYLRRKISHFWEKTEDNDVFLDTLLFYSSAIFSIALVGLSVTVTNGIRYFDQPVFDTIVYAHLLSMWWISRRFRWVLYEDRDGFVNIRPHLTFWTLVHRTPLAYVLVLAVVGGASLLRSTPYALEISFVPLVTILAYFPFRYYRVDGHMYRQLPRSEYEPDDWAIEQYVRDVFLTYEQRQALRPRNRLWTELSRVRTNVKAASRELRTADPERSGSLQPPDLLLAGITDEERSTYERRKERLKGVRAYVRRVRKKVERYDGDDRDELLEYVDDAEKAVDAAWETNEEVGPRRIDRLTEWLF